MRKRNIVGAISLAALVTVASSTPAHASEDMHVRGTACSGGYISALYYYTQYETTNSPAYAGNEFDIHLREFERFGGTQLHFSIKCSNNQWYYPVRDIPFWAVNPYWVGAV